MKVNYTYKALEKVQSGILFFCMLRPEVNFSYHPAISIHCSLITCHVIVWDHQLRCCSHLMVDGFISLLPLFKCLSVSVCSCCCYVRPSTSPSLPSLVRFISPLESSATTTSTTSVYTPRGILLVAAAALWSQSHRVEAPKTSVKTHFSHTASSALIDIIFTLFVSPDWNMYILYTSSPSF